MADYRDAPGEVATKSDLRSKMATSLVRALDSQRIPYVRLLEKRQSETFDIIVVDVDVEVAQVRTHDILPVERCALLFDYEDKATPRVLALRTTFPKVPHLNLVEDANSRDLCLYEEGLEEIRRHWTPARFIHRLREWLKLTADGVLHQDDQPLEPLLSQDVGYLAVPNDFESQVEHGSTPWGVYGHEFKRGRYFVHLAKIKRAKLKFAPVLLTLPPQESGLIHRTPTTLAGLDGLLSNAGFDLKTHLVQSLRDWKNEEHFGAWAEATVLLILRVPLTRGGDSTPETLDTYAFITDTTLAKLGSAIGIWEPQGRVLATLLQPQINIPPDIVAEPLRVVHDLAPATAARLNGMAYEAGAQPAGIVIGCGALGSQVVMNLARCGIGSWHLIDGDLLLPHNVARHHLTSSLVGNNKAMALATVANTVIPRPDLFTYQPDFITSPSDINKDALVKADMIIDMSTSISLARAISCSEASPRGVSVFLSPSGNDLVVLAEDSQRQFRLHGLEIQYYRAVATEEVLANHLDTPSDRIRYSRSCRDVTSTIRQSAISIHGGLAAQVIEEVLETAEARISVYRISEQGVVAHHITPSPQTCFKRGDWTVHIDNRTIQELHHLRAQKLPRETGGILIGSFDMHYKQAFIVDVLAAPLDSVEEQTSFVRGVKGLSESLSAYRARCGEMLEYLGEWHSHPPGCPPTPSRMDIFGHAELVKEMNAEGLPAVMVIVGEGEPEVVVGEALEH